MSARQITAALFVDCGEGFEIRSGDRAGQIRWTRQPRAKFECLRCNTSEGPVSGPREVTAFVARIRTDHVCHATQQAA